jgi:hypothetical protein
VIVIASDVAFHNQSACAFEFLTLFSSAVKLVLVSGKVMSWTMSKPKRRASSFTLRFPSCPKPPLSFMSAIRRIPSLRRWIAIE